MARVVVLILHVRAEPGAGPLTTAFGAIRRRNAERQAAGFRAVGGGAAEVGVEVIVDDNPLDGGSFGGRLREAATALGVDGVVVLGSGSIPLATAADRREFVAVAAGPAGRALANNAYSADVVAIGGSGRLAGLPDLTADNVLPRWLAADGGFAVGDLRNRWRLQMDLDSPLDALLCRPAAGARLGEVAATTTATVRAALDRVGAAARDDRRELIVAGRASATSLAWLERSTASRTRAVIEERGFRTRPAGASQRPVASIIGLAIERDGPEALGPLLARLGDAALVDSRVLIAHRCGADETSWPAAEDRFASDLLLPDRIADPWLAALTRSARDAPIPVVLGGHSLVGPGLRLALGRRAWT